MTIETHRVLGRTGVQVTPLTLGTMNFGRWQDESESVRIIGAAIDAGITPIDTADVYAKGASEEIVAKAIKGRRDEVFLATKFHGQIGTDPRSGGELAAMDHRGGRGKFASALAAADALAALAEDNGLTLVELSIAFALNHPAISTVIIGPRTHQHLEAYLKASTVELTDETLDGIDDIVDPGTQFHDRDTGRDTPSLQPDALRRKR